MLGNELLFLAHIVAVSISVIWGLWYSHGALLAVLGVQMVLANLFVSKQIMLFGIETNCSEVFIVGGMYGISLMRTYYSPHACQRAIYTIFGALSVFVLLIQFNLAYGGVDAELGSQLLFLCGSSARLLIASVCAYLVSEQAHLFFCSLLDKNNDSAVWQVAAIIGGQFIDSVVFGYIGLYGVVNHLVSVILFSIVVKIIVALALSPMIALTRVLIPPKPWQK